MSSFNASFVYQPSLCEFEEDEVAVPLVQANLQQKHLAAGPCCSLTLVPAHTEAGQIGGGLQPHHIIQVRKFGCPRKMLPSTWTPRSWPEVNRIMNPSAVHFIIAVLPQGAPHLPHVFVEAGIRVGCGLSVYEDGVCRSWFTGRGIVPKTSRGSPVTSSAMGG